MSSPKPCKPEYFIKDGIRTCFNLNTEIPCFLPEASDIAVVKRTCDCLKLEHPVSERRCVFQFGDCLQMIFANYCQKCRAYYVKPEDYRILKREGDSAQVFLDMSKNETLPRILEHFGRQNQVIRDSAGVPLVTAFWLKLSQDDAIAKEMREKGLLVVDVSRGIRKEQGAHKGERTVGLYDYYIMLLSAYDSSVDWRQCLEPNVSDVSDVSDVSNEEHSLEEHSLEAESLSEEEPPIKAESAFLFSLNADEEYIFSEEFLNDFRIAYHEKMKDIYGADIKMVSSLFPLKKAIKPLEKTGTDSRYIKELKKRFVSWAGVSAVGNANAGKIPNNPARNTLLEKQKSLGSDIMAADVLKMVFANKGRQPDITNINHVMLYVNLLFQLLFNGAQSIKDVSEAALHTEKTFSSKNKNAHKKHKNVPSVVVTQGQNTVSNEYKLWQTVTGDDFTFTAILKDDEAQRPINDKKIEELKEHFEVNIYTL